MGYRHQENYRYDGESMRRVAARNPQCAHSTLCWFSIHASRAVGYCAVSFLGKPCPWESLTWDSGRQMCPLVAPQNTPRVTMLTQERLCACPFTEPICAACEICGLSKAGIQTFLVGWRFASVCKIVHAVSGRMGQKRCAAGSVTRH
jgi:hypothetical protein